ncbi:hypothetical protein Egran_06720, partial [Elaphomyces granulatus]
EGPSARTHIPSSINVKEAFNFTSVPNNAAVFALGPRCGPGEGQCDHGLCCSPSGYCGNTKHYCISPGCQIDYGNCDASRTPEGGSTTNFPRLHLGEVPYGHGIFSCTVPKTIALTFDDGPNTYTGDLLDILDSFKAKATFFITGINSGKGEIDDFTLPWGRLIQRMHYSGHQIASHSWSHQDLSKITSSQRYDQMLKNEAALRNIFGAIPTYMRPPYSSCTINSGCLDDMGELGYHVTYYNVDTDDYNNDHPEYIQRSKDIFDRALAMQDPPGRPFLVIAHDVHKQTVYNLTSYILEKTYASGFSAVTVGECLGDPKYNWYRWI